jgi:hypothetical protein
MTEVIKLEKHGEGKHLLFFSKGETKKVGCKRVRIFEEPSQDLQIFFHELRKWHHQSSEDPLSLGKEPEAITD